jgi:hypothetical protein
MCGSGRCSLYSKSQTNQRYNEVRGKYRKGVESLYQRNLNKKALLKNVGFDDLFRVHLTMKIKNQPI